MLPKKTIKNRRKIYTLCNINDIITSNIVNIVVIVKQAGLIVAEVKRRSSAV